MKNQRFNVVVHKAVASEIQEAADYYKVRNKPLGTKFYKLAKKTLKTLENDALLYQIKYKNVRCIKIKGFPYLIHYSINSKTHTVRVYALICTYKNPEGNWIP